MMPRWTSACVAALTLAGCADMQGIGPSARMTDAAQLGLASASAAETETLGPAQDWWTALGDAQLDGLVAEALAHNPNLQVAAARVAKARSVEQVAASASSPQVNGELDLNRQKFSSNYIYPPPLGGAVFDMGNLQAGGSWELDFFGKNSDAIRAAIGQLRAAEAESDAAHVLLAANVVRAYVQWARLNEQRVLAERALAQRQEMLAIVRDRVQAGLDTQLEVRQNETGRADSRTQIAVVEQQIDASRNALAALLGQPRLADEVRAPLLAQFKPLAVPSELNADWLARRADIAAARWRVEAARAQVDVARAQFYPNINLAAFIGYQSLGFGNLVKSDSFQWGVGPAIRLPIFEGGRLRANLVASSADTDAAIESYNATVIDAMRDVADQSQAVQATARQQREQALALQAAQGAYNIAQQRYAAGLGNYLNVLLAETAVLAQRRQQADLAAQAIQSQIGVAQAMGGGWRPTPALAALPAAEDTQAAAGSDSGVPAR
ncbi:MAG: efflux transporter outer membrane subunit [Burkholderiaceae bacterium]|jgi:NodT family efflux transporter outer membrane factor (OMF) lipoprotein|nr:efflux transporter outer membrane subunit [Burkholderiaceae bacterium]